MYLHRNELPPPPKYGKYEENSSSKIFSCIRASANTGPACIGAKISSPRIFPACIGFVPGGIFFFVVLFSLSVPFVQKPASPARLRTTLHTDIFAVTWPLDMRSRPPSTAVQNLVGISAPKKKVFSPPAAFPLPRLLVGNPPPPSIFL